MKDQPHAVVVNLEYNDLGLGDTAVFLFDSEAEAIAWQFKKLVETGEIVFDDAQIWSKERDTLYASEVAAVEDWKDQMGLMDLFHAYPIREATAP